MAKQTLINRETAKLSDAEKAIAKADKLVVSVAKAGDKAVLTAVRDRINYVLDTLEQTGEQTGKRFNGAATHEFADQLAAYAETVIRGNIPRAS